MAHALGTLMLPWSASTQRASSAVPVDPALAVTLILALIGVVMVFSASAVAVGATGFTIVVFPQTAGRLVGRRPAVMHLISRIDYTIWKKLAIPLLCGGYAVARVGAHSIARECGKGAFAVHLGRSIFSRPRWRNSWPSSMRLPI